MKKILSFMIVFCLSLYFVSAAGFTGFTLVDADSDLDISALNDGSTINYAALPTTNLNVRADLDISVGSVMFYLDGSLFRIENVAPYALAGDRNGDYREWTPDLGSHVLTAEAYSGSSGSGTLLDLHSIAFDVVDQENLHPSVNIVSPSDGDVFNESDNITIAVNASDPDGNVLLVEFLANDVKLGEDSSVPYSFSWINVTEGNYGLTAKSTDDNNATTTSSTVAIIVEAFSNETNVSNSTYPPVALFDFNISGEFVPVNVTFDASSSFDIDGSITRYEWNFGNGQNGSGEIVKHAYNNEGNYTVTLTVRDDNNLTNSSSTVLELSAQNATDNSTSGNSSVEDIVFTLVNADTDADIEVLDDGSTINYAALPTSNLNIRADPNSSVGSVSFYLDGSLIRTESTAPYALAGDSNGDYNSWTPDLGSYVLTAEAYSDSSGGGSLVSTRTIEIQVIDQEDPRPSATFSLSPWAIHSDDNYSTLITANASGSTNSTGGDSLVYEWVLPDSASTNSSTSSEVVEFRLPEGNEEILLWVFDPDNISNNDSASMTIGNIQSGNITNGSVTGELRKWHRIELTFDGPAVSESGNPNPFLDYRLDVTFTSPSGNNIIVPGFFAADGNAAESSASSGNKWKVRFAPNEVGNWSYMASFRTGSNVAVADDPFSGSSAGYFDGASGSFTISPTNKTGRDNRGKGLLEYVGGHYLQWAETGEYFVKAGTDAPENFLAYEDFDNTPDYAGYRKSWAPHASDWNNGDPSWQGGKGTEIIGAVNYLAGEGLNVFSFLTMNIDGDDKNVFPYISDTDPTRLDVSKLAQWEILFDHADKKGMFLHFKTQEIENDGLLDGGALGTQRKLYYRELIARFGHHLALNWNLGEENTNTDAERKAFADYFKAIDPYDHPVVVHTLPNEREEVYSSLLGHPTFDGPSLQTSSDMSIVHSETLEWRNRSSNAGHPWIVSLDEPGSAGLGVECDGSGNNHDYARMNALWGNLMAGGAGVEWYFGYQTCHGSGNQSDLTAQDFRSRDAFWDYNRHALNFFDNISFWQMASCDSLIVSDGNYCLGEENETYAFYQFQQGNLTADLPPGEFELIWYNPRTGIFEGNSSFVAGADNTILGPAPFSGDAVALLVRINNLPPTENNPPSVPGNLNAVPIKSDSVFLSWNASVDDEAVSGYKVYRDSVFAASTAALNYTDLNLSSSTVHTYKVSAIDNEGLESNESLPVSVETGSSPVLQSIVVSPGSVSLVDEEDLQFSAQGFDQYGDSITTNVVWSVQPGSTITQDGLFSARVYTVVASDGNISGNSTVAVSY